MKLLDQVRQWLKPGRPVLIEEPSLDEAEDPFDQPVEMEIRDVIDLHSIRPKQVKAVVEEYLIQARARNFRYVRIIHGKGIGVQREIVRKILSRTPFVIDYRDAPSDSGGPGATIAELAIPDGVE